MKDILDPDFKYRPSYDTNLHETFKRVRREQEFAKAKKQEKLDHPPRLPLRRVQ